MTLDQLRTRLSQVDRELVGLIAARQQIVAESSAHKIMNAVPTRDYEREREVLKGARDQAQALGLDADFEYYKAHGSSVSGATSAME